MELQLPGGPVRRHRCAARRQVALALLFDQLLARRSGPGGHGGRLAITVKAMPEGFLSEHLVRGLAPGTIVRLALPTGEFVLPDPPPAKILFWTGGSGSRR